MEKYAWADDYLLSMPGAEKDYKAEWGWDRYLVCGRMFAAVCTPGLQHKQAGGHTLLTLKCDPMESELLRSERKDIIPGFYMDKRNWISVLLDGDVPDDLLRYLCERSYRLVFSHLTKKERLTVAPDGLPQADI